MEFSYKAVGTPLYPKVHLIIRSGASFMETHAILDPGSRFSLFQSHLVRQSFPDRVNLIGCTDFFDKFIITFDEAPNKVMLEKSLL